MKGKENATKTLIAATIVGLLAVAAISLVEGNLTERRKSNDTRAHHAKPYINLAHEILAHGKQAKRLSNGKNTDFRHGNEDDEKDNYDEDEDYEDNLELLFHKCVQQHGGTEDDIEKYLEPKRVDSREFACVAGCLYESVNVTLNGTLNKPMFVVFLVFRISEEDAYKAADSCVDDLAKVPDDICERGWAIDVCFMKAAIPGYQQISDSTGKRNIGAGYLKNINRT